MLASVETLYGRQAPAPMFTLNPLHLVRLNQAFPARKKGQTIQNYSIFFRDFSLSNKNGPLSFDHSWARQPAWLPLLILSAGLRLISIANDVQNRFWFL